MSGRPGLRLPAYAGKDASADQAFRSVEVILRFLQRLPFSDGTFLQGQDFSAFAASGTRTYQLKHTLRRPARGIMVVGCHAIGASTALPDSLPVHAKELDTNYIANVRMNAAMANGFTWDLWVW